MKIHMFVAKGPKAVRKFSENSSVLVWKVFPNLAQVTIIIMYEGVYPCPKDVLDNGQLKYLPWW